MIYLLFTTKFLRPSDQFQHDAFCWWLLILIIFPTNGEIILPDEYSSGRLFWSLEWGTEYKRYHTQTESILFSFHDYDINSIGKIYSLSLYFSLPNYWYWSYSRKVKFYYSHHVNNCSDRAGFLLQLNFVLNLHTRFSWS